MITNSEIGNDISDMIFKGDDCSFRSALLEKYIKEVESLNKAITSATQSKGE